MLTKYTKTTVERSFNAGNYYRYDEVKIEKNIQINLRSIKSQVKFRKNGRLFEKSYKLSRK